MQGANKSLLAWLNTVSRLSGLKDGQGSSVQSFFAYRCIHLRFISLEKEMCMAISCCRGIEYLLEIIFQKHITFLRCV